MDDPSSGPRKGFVVVANRLPVSRTSRPAGWRTSPGGLVAALAPVLPQEGAAWVGWAGQIGRSPAPFRIDNLDLVPIPLSRREFHRYYEGFSNATLWPLFHDAVRQPEYVDEWWQAYRAVNERFADAAAEAAAPGAIVWVHDYQLLLVPELLRRRRSDVRIGFFLHIPFPPPELFRRLPWRDDLVAGVAAADLVGFQTRAGARNFSRLDPNAKVGAFPISIDTPSWEALASQTAIARRAAKLRTRLGRPRMLLLGVDRLDYTKGIDQRLAAFRELLASGEVRAGDAVLVQIATPTREDVALYVEQRERIEKMVGEINGDYGAVGRPAVHYLHRNVDRDDLAALYRAADVMLVTPLADGMNLVAKEYVACRVDNSGVLVLSEFAGAAHELRDAMLVNPYDVSELRMVMGEALRLSADEAHARMTKLRAVVRRNDVHRWARRYLDALTSL